MFRKSYVPPGLTWRLVLAVAAALAWSVDAMSDDSHSTDQTAVHIEVQPTDPSLTKIVLVAGHPSHGPGEHEFFAGCALLMQLLKETPGVFPVMAKDGWPKDPKTFEGGKTIVFFMDGRGGPPIIQGNHMDELQKLIDHGVGFVNLHYAVDYPRKQGDT